MSNKRLVKFEYDGIGVRLNGRRRHMWLNMSQSMLKKKIKNLIVTDFCVLTYMQLHEAKMVCQTKNVWRKILEELVSYCWNGIHLKDIRKQRNNKYKRNKQKYFESNDYSTNKIKHRRR